jgi:Tol biopolymer transport system component
MPPTPVKAGNVSDLEMDLKTRTLTSIIWPKNTQIGGYTVSPDGKRIAYWKILYSNEKRQIARSIIIEDANGNILKELSGDVETWKTFYWLDNQRIVIGMDGQPYVLNPFTGEGYDLSKWYAQSPGGLKTIPVWDVNGIFDSQLSRLFYIQEDDTLLLWDLKIHQILVRINPNSSFSSDDQPKWAWDDSEIVLGRASGAENQGEELFSVSRDGKINQLTELSKEYHQVAILKFNWSPNGQNIAFFFRDKSKENNVSQFAVLNRKTLKIINFCNLSGFMQPNVEPVWSPDGNKLLIGRLEADSKTYKTVLLDLSNETAAILTENRIPAGWMVAP